MASRMLTAVDLLFIHHSTPIEYYINTKPYAVSGVNGGSYMPQKYTPNYSISRIESPMEIRSIESWEMSKLKERTIDLIFKELSNNKLISLLETIIMPLTKKELNAKHLVPLYEMLIELRIKNV